MGEQQMALKEIASLWIGSPPSYLEHVVIKSYLAAGHAMTVYSDRPEGEFPSGVQVIPPMAITPDLAMPHPNAGYKAMAVYSDVFRLYLLMRRDVIWVDMDAYCTQAFDFSGDDVFGQGEGDIIPNGILGFATNSPVPQFLLDEMRGVNPKPIWLRDKVKTQLAEVSSWALTDLPWGVTGPRALTHALRKYDLHDLAHPKEVFYSTLGALAWKELFAPPDGPSTLITPLTKSVHFFGRCREILAKTPGVNPYNDGYIAKICAQHDVRPADAPITVLQG